MRELEVGDKFVVIKEPNGMFQVVGWCCEVITKNFGCQLTVEKCYDSSVYRVKENNYHWHENMIDWEETEKLYETGKEDAHNKYDKPPIGVVTTKIWLTERKNSIEDAIEKRLYTSHSIPTEWIVERNELVSMISKISKIGGVK